jgi:hypothetical protein
MKKKNWKIRTFLVLVGVLLTGLVMYWVMDRPVFSEEAMFRRAEREHALGPGTILGTEPISSLDLSYYDCDIMIVAETKYGAILYCCKLNENDYLFYREKKGPLTIMALPNGHWSWLKDQPRQLDVILFDDYPEAVRAQVQIIVDWPHNFYGFTPDGVYYTYDLTAQRENDGYFHFVHTIYGSDYIDNDNAAMGILTDITCHTAVYEAYTTNLQIPAMVRLYDADNNLLVEETLTLRSIAAEEREKMGK